MECAGGGAAHGWASNRFKYRIDRPLYVYAPTLESSTILWRFSSLIDYPTESTQYSQPQRYNFHCGKLWGKRIVKQQDDDKTFRGSKSSSHGDSLDIGIAMCFGVTQGIVAVDVTLRELAKPQGSWGTHAGDTKVNAFPQYPPVYWYWPPLVHLCALTFTANYSMTEPLLRLKLGKPLSRWILLDHK